MAEPAATITVQVCYARPGLQFLQTLQVASGATLEQAIRASGLLEQAEEIDLAHLRVGIYGKLKTLDTLLRAGDRVEIYRPLSADPKDARRRRVAAAPGKKRARRAGGLGSTDS